MPFAFLLDLIERTENDRLTFSCFLEVVLASPVRRFGLVTSRGVATVVGLLLSSLGGISIGFMKLGSLLWYNGGCAILTAMIRCKLWFSISKLTQILRHL